MLTKYIEKTKKKKKNESRWKTADYGNYLLTITKIIF